MPHTEVVRVLEGVAREYPAEMVDEQIADVERIAFHIELVTRVAGKPLPQLSLCDIGGGVGMFTSGLAALGCGRVILVDDFRDPVNAEFGERALAVHRRYGVQVVSRDVVAEGVADLALGPLDVVTSFDSMEHFHHSPKRLFHQLVEQLAPGGAFILATPNNVNLRKRLSALRGRSPWTTIETWYEHEVFRGHVREPDVHDLRYIARDVGLEDVRVVGRNWAGTQSPRPAVRTAARLLNGVLRLRPSLCSDIYMIGRTPRRNAA